MKRKTKKSIILISFLVLAIILIFAAFYNGLTVKNYKVETDKLSKSIRIVLISDLHNKVFGDNQRVLINEIKKQAPDIIVLDGDIIENYDSLDGAKMLLKGIENLYPCYFVTGNHEFSQGKAEAIKQLFRSFGVIVLEGDYKNVLVKGQHINLCGVDDPNIGLQNFNNQLEALQGLDSKTYSILLSHRPEIAAECKNNSFDLILSGHTHGGMWRIPFLVNGLFATDQGFFPKYAGGRYDYNNTAIIVGRGFTGYSFVPRIFNPPELVVVDIGPK